MANELDELTGPVNQEGRDVAVIEKQLPIKVGIGSKIFEVLLWVLAIIPGVVFLFMKIKAGNYLSQLQQKLQHDASQIDNYLEQRVVILQNCAKLLDKAIDLDKTTMTQIAAYRSGHNPADDGERNAFAQNVDAVGRSINLAFENYPELKAHAEIADAMQQNDTVNVWNRDIYAWPTKMIVAAKRGYTTRIPFTASAEVKEQARGVFF